MRHRRLLVTGVAVAVVALVGLWLVNISVARPKAPDLLEQIHAAFEMYGEDFDSKYPPMSGRPGEFVPDMDAFGPYLAPLPQGDLLSAYLTGKCGVQLCYFGYAVPTQRATLALLDEYEKQGVGDFGDDDVRLEAAGVSYGHVFRLRDGIERFFITAVSRPSAVEETQGWLPVLWEMPDTAPAAGGWVLYMNGHMEWLPYGNFPMTDKIVERLRSFGPTRVTRGRDSVYRVDSRPPVQYRWTKRRPSPVHQIAADIIDRLPALFYKLEQCDVRPTVTVGRHRGYRIRLSGGLELVLFPDDINVNDTFKQLIWPGASRGEGVFPVDMGIGHGYRWFALVQPREHDFHLFLGPALAMVLQQDTLREEFGLAGGDDRLEAMINANAFYLMPRLGERAVPYLESVLADEQKRRHFPYVLMALDRIESARAEQLVRDAFAPDNEYAFKNAEALANPMLMASPYPLKNSTVDMIAEVFLTHEDPDDLVHRAIRYATLTGMMDTSKMNQIGKEILRRLPQDVFYRALESLHDASPSQAQRLEHELRKGHE